MNPKLDRPEWGLAVLRIVLGIVFFVHGWPKLMGGGVNMVQGMLASVGWPVPALFAWIVTLLEFFGGLALIAGAFTRPVAALLAVEMVIAALLFHVGKGFVVFRPEGQWGYEFNLTLLAATVCLVLAGAGAWSVDGVLARRKRAAAPMM